MKNGCIIEWSGEALSNLHAIFDYLETKWTERELVKFTNRLDTTLKTIAIHPEAFPLYDMQKNVRRCVLSKQTTIYYKPMITANKIFIVTLFDNRQNPAKLKL